MKMEARTRSSKAPVLPFTFNLRKSQSSAGYFNLPSPSSAFKTGVNRMRSPNRANGASSYSSSACAAASSSINFVHDSSASQVRYAGHPISPKIDASVKSISCAPPKRSCMCSPTNHPGSFIGGVEGEWVRRALIRPSSHHMRSRTLFQPRPSRLCHMTTAQDICGRLHQDLPVFRFSFGLFR